MVHLRLVQLTGGLTPEASLALGTLLDRGRHASVRRAGLHSAAGCWDAAERRSAAATARADIIVGLCADARVLTATRVGCVAHAALSEPACRSPLAGLPAADAFDSASVATWLRWMSQVLGTADLYHEACQLAMAVLAHPGTTDDILADAWMTVYGVALLEELAGSHAVPDAEARLIQRTVSATLARLRLVGEPRIARLTGVDRLTLARWLRFGPPSANSQGHQISAPTCAALAGMTSSQWRSLSARDRVPLPVCDIRGTRSWDEGEVVHWVRSHTPDQCRCRCHRHQPAPAPARIKVAAPGQANVALDAPFARPSLTVVT